MTWVVYAMLKRVRMTLCRCGDRYAGSAYSHDCINNGSATATNLRYQAQVHVTARHGGVSSDEAGVTAHHLQRVVTMRHSRQ